MMTRPVTSIWLYGMFAGTSSDETTGVPKNELTGTFCVNVVILQKGVVEAVGVPVAVGELGTTVGDGVDVRGGVGDRVTVGVLVLVGVLVGVFVGVFVGVAVLVDVGRSFGGRPRVGGRVGVPVGVAVAGMVGVAVNCVIAVAVAGCGVSVTVGVSVSVGVGLGVMVAVGNPPGLPGACGGLVAVGGTNGVLSG